MSFLSGIKNFIKTEILGIEETNTDIQNVKRECYGGKSTAFYKKKAKQDPIIYFSRMLTVY